MKTIDVIINGEINYIDYCTVEDKEYDEEHHWDDGWSLDYDSLMLIEPNSVEVEGTIYEQEDGDYPWSQKYTPIFAHLFSKYGFPEEPMYLWIAKYKERCVYKLELEDDEEFDIHKLTFIQSYEFNMLEDCCLYSHILYDGKKLEMTPEEDDEHVCSAIGNSHSWEYEIEEFDDNVLPNDSGYIELPKEYR